MLSPGHAIDVQAGDPGVTSLNFFANLLLVCKPVSGKVLFALISIVFSFPVHAQSTASIEGQVTDPQGAVVSAAQVIARSPDISITRTTTTDETGRYQLVALPVGTYSIEVRSRGFQTQKISSFPLEVARRVTQNFQLAVGDVTQAVTVTTNGVMIESSTTSVGHVMDRHPHRSCLRRPQLVACE